MHRDQARPNQSLVEGELTAHQRARAVRKIASAASDARDCALLLEALGLSAEEGVAERDTQANAS